jgi:GNAT superfamily N-acetyltransferase
MEIIIRAVEAADATTVSTLAGQFGYPNTVEEVRFRIQALQGSATDFAWVAVEEGWIIGWIQITRMMRLESGEFVEITGLVVDETKRNLGVGATLVRFVKDYCRKQGITRLVVRSNVIRNQAHRFYLSNGFSEKKQQKVFECPIP